jgi:peroxiredoxin
MPVSHHPVRVTLILLLTASLVTSVHVAFAAADNPVLPAAAEHISPLQAGDRAPVFTVQTVANEPYDFDPDNLERPTVLISFRGGWCPYCNIHLSELRHVIPQIKQSGFDVLFLSNDRPELLYDSLKDETQESIEGLDYLILSDADLNAARALGTAFAVTDADVERKHHNDIDIEGSSMDKYKALAVPAVVVIGTSGVISFIYANPDYKIRLSADELKQATEELLAQ